MSPGMQPGPAPSGGSGGKFAILIGLLVGQLIALVVLFYQVGGLKQELASQRTTVDMELAKLRETTTVTSQTNRRTVAKLQDDLEAQRRQAAIAVGQTRAEAMRKVDETERALRAAQAKQEQAFAVAKTEIAEVKETAATTSAKLGEVSTEVGTVKTEVSSTKAELDKTIANLKAVTGDLGVQSGLIATNSKELGALRALGERNYVEFSLMKAKQPSRVGDVMILLKKADPKRNRFTIELVADDKKSEKKDRTVNEPVQFYVAKARQPYEMVVNEVKKDQIVGYLSVPKVQAARN